MLPRSGCLWLMGNYQDSNSSKGESIRLRSLSLWALLSICHSGMLRFILVVVVCILLLLFYITALSEVSLSSLLFISKIDISSHDMFHKGKEDNGSMPGTVLNAANKPQKVPDVIIVGVQSAGVRALSEYLSLHPVAVVKLDQTHFFTDEEKYSQGLEWYRSQMPWSDPGQLLVEKAPACFASSLAPARIRQMNPSVRLLIILRNPATRAVSDYTQTVAVRHAQGLSPSENFNNLVINTSTGMVNPDSPYVWLSTYHLHMALWLKIFPLSRIHIVDGDRLITEPVSELRKVERFLRLRRYLNESIVYLKLTSGFHCRRRLRDGVYRDQCLSRTEGRKHFHINDSVRGMLALYFYSHNELLYRMIGQRFTWF